MTGLGALIKRNCKLFFKDKGLFITSLITPMILLVLYATFLRSVYYDSFSAALPAMASIPEKLINGTVSAQLVSSLLAVSCVTVGFCSNMLMVQDKINGSRKDLTMTPVRKSVMALGYYAATVISTLLVCLATAGLCFLYLAKSGWYMSWGDGALLLLDVVLLVLFGACLSSIINVFLSTQGQISAVGTIVSSGYGFICGAYMPIANFSKGLQRVLSFLPGTYGTALLRNHAMAGCFREMEAQGFPKEIVEKIKDSIDCNLYFFGNQVSVGGMYAILGGAVAVLVGVYILLTYMSIRKNSK